MTDVRVAPASAIRGEVELPGDKSISHRAVLIASLGTRTVRITNIVRSEDVNSTIAAVSRLGVDVIADEDDPTSITVTGRGMRGLVAPTGDIDCGNAGTLARLLPGILVGQEGTFRLVGDESLSRRPMMRIAEPLAAMGAQLQLSTAGTLPFEVRAGTPLHGGDFEIHVASAQLQSAILLAALYADAPTTLAEPAIVRDHTERMLRRAGVAVRRSGLTVTVEPAGSVELPDTDIPADTSAAAPLIVAATVLHDSLLRLPGVLINPGRTGLLDHMERMGARVGVAARREHDGELVADLEVTHADLRRSFLPVEDVARTIDELPLLGLLAQFTRGESVIRGAEELRVKESDRISTLVKALRGIGIAAEERRDGFVVRGSGTRPDGGIIHAEGDHRIAMLGGIAGLVSRSGVTVHGAECVDVSFPGFFGILEQLASRS